MNLQDSASRKHPMSCWGSKGGAERPHSDEERPHSDEERPLGDASRPLGDELAFDRPASDATFDLMNRPNGDASMNYLDSGRQCVYENLPVCYS